MFDEQERADIALAFAAALPGFLEHVEEAEREVVGCGSYSIAAVNVSHDLRHSWDVDYAAGVAAMAMVELVRLGYPGSTTYLEQYR
jgi:hypothetical protein